MTIPNCFTSDGRRYSRVEPPLPHALPPYGFQDHRRIYHAPHDSHRTTIMTERDHESESNPPRKRIAVACQRCRKRKIRCSGDPGNGQPCHNCKNAGADQCRFLRVSAQETPLRHDLSESFQYNVDSARTFQARQSSVSPLGPGGGAQFGADGGIPGMASGEMLGYRHGSGYQYPGKPYYAGVPGWAQGYPEDGVDYGLEFSSGAKYAANQNLYADVDQGYGYATSSPTLRNPVDGMPAYHMSSVTTAPASMPPQLHTDSKERLLPGLRATRTPLPSGPMMPYRGESSPGSYSSSGKLPGSSSSALTTMPDVKFPISDVKFPISDVKYPISSSGAYGAFDGSSLSGYAHQSSSQSSGMSVSGRSSPPRSSGGGDVYSSNAGESSLYSSADTGLRSHGSSSEMAYRYTDPRGDGSSSSSSGGGQLANGHVYAAIPPPATGVGSAAYLMSVAEMGEGGVDGQQHHRRTLPGLHSA